MKTSRWVLGAVLLGSLTGAALTGAALAAGVPAQQGRADRVRVTAYPQGIFRLQAGRISSSLDLGEQLSGCTAGTYDGSDPKSRPSGGEAQTRVIDLVQKGGLWYLTFQATLESNCNVQGECGAATDTTLVWLKLTPALRVAAKQAEVVEDCRADKVVTSGDSAAGNSGDGTDPLRLDLRGGVLRVVSEASDYVAKTDTVTTVRYLHTAPERGLSVSSSKTAQK